MQLWHKGVVRHIQGFSCIEKIWRLSRFPERLRQKKVCDEGVRWKRDEVKHIIDFTWKASDGVATARCERSMTRLT